MFSLTKKKHIASLACSLLYEYERESLMEHRLGVRIKEFSKNFDVGP